MKRSGAIALFAAIFVFALVLLCPLGAGIAVSGVGSSGLSARSATGTIWSGTLADAYVGPVPIGDVDVALRPLPLLAGRGELGVVGTSGAGRVIGGAGEFGIGQVIAKLALGQALAPLPIDTLDLGDVTVRFDGGRCADAEGRVRATFTEDVAGIDLKSGLSGAVRCDGGELLLPLVSQSGTQRLTMRIAANGRWKSVLTVRATDPAIVEKLGATGFGSAGGAFVLRFSGTL